MAAFENQRWKFLRTFINHSFLIFLTVVYVIFVPLLLLPQLPILLTRLLLQVTSRYLGFESILSGQNAIFATDSIYDGPCRASLVVRSVLNGPVKSEKFWQDRVLARIVEKRKNPGQNIWAYPELRQFVVTFLGFYFWKKDQEFDIRAHVKFYLLDRGGESLESVQEKLIPRAYQPGRSPWEFLVGNNGEDETILFLRIHHCLADGMAIMVLMKDLLNATEEIPPRRKVQSGTANGARQALWAFWRIPYDQVRQRWESRDINELHNSGIKLQRVYHPLPLLTLDLERIKRISKQSCPGTTVTSVILYGITLALGQYFRSGNGSMPQNLHCISPMPMPYGGREILGNYWSFIFTKLPVGNVQKDPAEILGEINGYLNEVRTSTLTAVNFALIPFVGWLNSSQAKFWSRNVFSTGIVSNFRGPKQVCEMEGLRMKEISFVGGLLHGDQGLCFTILSYAGKIRISTLVDKALMDRTSGEKIVSDIHYHIHSLDPEFIP